MTPPLRSVTPKALQRFWNFSKHVCDTGLDTAKESALILMTGLLKTFSRVHFLDALQQDANQLPHHLFPWLQFILDSTDRISCFKYRSYYNPHLLKTLQSLLLLPAFNPPFIVEHSRPLSITLSLVELL